MSLNSCMFIGNLGRDPEVRSMPSGEKIVNLSVGVSEAWKDKETGEKKSRVEWVKVVIFNEGIGKVAEKYLKKGSKIYIEGALQTRKWTDQTNVDRYTTEIVLQKFRGKLVLLDSAKSGAEEKYDKYGTGKENGRHAGLDDEIPF